VSQPPAFNRSFSFTKFQAANPMGTVPGSQIDLELNNVKATTDQVIANLTAIQRDDDALKNGSVTFDTLSTSLQTAGAYAGSALGHGNCLRTWRQRHTRQCILSLLDLTHFRRFRDRSCCAEAAIDRRSLRYCAGRRRPDRGLGECSLTTNVQGVDENHLPR
jgi:hypothetical protein